MGIDCYCALPSTPCRAVFMTAEALGLKLNLKELDLMAGEQLKPEFLKINIQHNVPTIDDNGFYLCESRAIMMYLVNAYGKTDTLYPKPAKQRALVDHRLFFDESCLYRDFEVAYYPAVFRKQPINEEGVKKLDETLGILDEFLDRSKYVAGDCITIADFSIMASLSTMEAIGVKFNKFQKVVAYFSKMKKEIKNYDETNGNGAKAFGEMAKYLMQQSAKQT